MANERNWAGNYTYNALEYLYPESVEEVQEIVLRNSKLRVLGSRHSFNGIADSHASLVSLQKMNRILALDKVNNRVKVEGGIRYGDLGEYLYREGYALHNLASLPHITIAGAISTATHGSGDRNGNLATAVYALEIVKADGTVAVFTRDDQDGKFSGAVVGLGALGVVTAITLDIQTVFEISQYIYDNLPLAQLENNFEAIFSSAYSVSLFTDWKDSTFNQVWQKRLFNPETGADAEAEFFGASLAEAKRHPVPAQTAENCSEQFGVPGPWHERLPHFRMDFTPSAGEELQTEYFVARQDAYHAIRAISELSEQISPLLFISEVRTIAADELWMSPSYKQDSVGFHFTWKPNWEAVKKVLPLIEEKLAPFHAKPHWAKLFTMPAERLQPLFVKLPDFRELMLECDPEGKFRNAYMEEYVLGKS
ncbi:FAD-binding protein [Paenibacillus glycanilyticus]|uniref:FAD-binding protein n=1 Tax=Paenibacillus glycanilyticus TaxID=126569 RepID=UPI00203EC179|nr:FAD-binding protein [Paenibacillus glycanilyticus]MCM3626499.1 FAD-binding protein [Paenibacillus glycanilyticus]